jgi:hypothetical protein
MRGKNIGKNYLFRGGGKSRSINKLNRKTLQSKIVEITETRWYISHNATLSWTKNSSEGKIIDLNTSKIKRFLNECETKLNSTS